MVVVMTIIMFVAYLILKPMEFICEVFAHFDFTSRRVEWHKWFLGILGAIAVSVAMMLMFVMALELNNNSGFGAISAIASSFKNLWVSGAMKELIARTGHIAISLLAFKLFALAFPYVTAFTIEMYRMMMRNARI